MSQCLACQRDLPEDARYCPACGASADLNCPVCDTVNAPDHKFCKHCGQNLAGTQPTTPAPTVPSLAPKEPHSYTPPHLVEKVLKVRATLEGERKQVTILFCDLCNSTRLAEALGPERMHGVIEAVFRLALDQVHAYQGTINQFLGDGFMALFGAPIAHERHARCAVLAALGLRDTLTAEAPQLLGDAASELQLRFGVNTGQVVVGTIGDNLRMDYTAVGESTNLAARITSHAGGNQVLVSEFSQRLTAKEFTWREHGARNFKGISRPIEIFEPTSTLVSRRDAEPVAPTASAFVGRDREVAALLSCIDGVLDNAQGQVVTLLGEAGIGKSALLAQAARHAVTRELRWLSGEAMSYGQNLAYQPFKQILRAWAGIRPDHSEADSFTCLRLAIEPLFGEQTGEILPYIAVMLGYTVPDALQHKVKYLDGAAMGQAIFLAMRRLIEAIARDAPLAIVVEDLHWADHATTVLLEHLFDLVHRLPILLLGVARSDPHTPAFKLRESLLKAHHEIYREIRLEPLDRRACGEIIDRLGLPAQTRISVQELIIENTAGNPLFLEEVVRSLLAGELSGRGGAELTDLERLQVPDSLQGVILARIDRLDHELGGLLKAASVIGRVFPRDLLAGILQNPPELDAGLQQLIAQDFIRLLEGGQRPQYQFKHALVEEAVYGTLVADRRRQLHLAAARQIEANNRQRLDEVCGALANHYAKAEQWDKAQHFLFRVGDQAGGMAADHEAIGHYQAAMDAYANAFGENWDPRERAQLEFKIGGVQTRLGQARRAMDNFQRALEHLGQPYPTTGGQVQRAILGQLLRQLLHRLLARWLLPKDPSRDRLAQARPAVYQAMGWTHFFEDRERLMLDVLLMLNDAERHGVREYISQGAMGVGLIFDFVPLWRIADFYHRRATREAQRAGHSIAEANAHLGRGLQAIQQGRWEAVIEHADAGAALYKEAGEIRRWGATIGMKVQMARYTGDLTLMRDLSAEIEDLGRDSADLHCEGWGHQGGGLALFLLGDAQAGLERSKRAIPLFESVNAFASIAEARSDLARFLLRAGRLADATALAESACNDIQRLGIRSFEMVSPINMLAECYLAAAERSVEPKHRRQWLRKAAKVCRRVRAATRLHHASTPCAMRHQGVLLWLSGRERAARKAWAEGRAAGEAMRCDLQTGLLLLDAARLGRRDQDRSDAAQIFTDLGAHADLDYLNRCIESA